MKLRRVLAALAVALVAVFAFALPARAAVKYSGTNGTCTWTIDDKGVLTIAPKNGTSGALQKNDPSSMTGWHWNKYRTEVKSIVINGTVTATDLSSCFSDFTNLTSANLNGLDTSKTTTMWGMFYNCPKIKTLFLTYFDTAKVKYIDEMFYGCSSLSAIYVSFDWKLTSLDGVSQDVFTGCTSLKGYSASKTSSAYAKYESGYLTAGDGGATIEGKDYYFYPDGKQAINYWIGRTGWLAFYGPDGALKKNELFYDNFGDLYYAQSDGHVIENNWMKVGGYWYYFGPYGVGKINDWIQYKGDWYFFDSLGRMVTNQVVTEGANTSFCYVGDDGKAVKGWKKLGDWWYYFDEWGEALVNTTLKYNGAWYFFGIDGRLCTDLLVIGTDNNLYYFGKDGKLVFDKWFSKDGKYYYAQKNGQVIDEGWVLYGGKYYYIKSNGQVAQNEWITWNGKQYHFGSNYACDQVK